LVHLDVLLLGFQFDENPVHLLFMGQTLLEKEELVKLFF
jgi:hypothetical protein